MATMKKTTKKPTVKEIANANKKRKKTILSQTTTKDVLNTLNDTYDLIDNHNLDYDYQLKWAFLRAIELAKTPSDAMMIFKDSCILDEPEEDLAFDKALDLCKHKEEVQEIMNEVCSWEPTLEYEKYFIKIFKRGHELPPLSEPDED
jgi:hypothetical protein